MVTLVRKELCAQVLLCRLSRLSFRIPSVLRSQAGCFCFPADIPQLPQGCEQLNHNQRIVCSQEEPDLA